MPLYIGLILFFGSLLLLQIPTNRVAYFHLTMPQICYIIASIVGAILIQTGADNISKRLKSGLMKDRFNVENESFEQTKQTIETDGAAARCH